MICESILGEHHNHLAEQTHEVPQRQIIPSHYISNGTTPYKPENMDWFRMDDYSYLFGKPDLTYLFQSQTVPLGEMKQTGQITTRA